MWAGYGWDALRKVGAEPLKTHVVQQQHVVQVSHLLRSRHGNIVKGHSVMQRREEERASKQVSCMYGRNMKMI